MPRATAVRKTERSAPVSIDGEDNRADPDGTRQFVIFHVKNEMFAVPLAEVKEIIRMPAIVRIPLSPPALEGIANLRGTMLPVVNLRTIFGFETVDHNDTTRVVVLDQGRPVGLVVDRMANVVTAEANSIEATGTIQSTVDTDLLTGMIKGQDGASMVMILDAGALIRREFQSGVERGTGGAVGEIAGDPVAEAVQAAAEEIQLVSFEVAGQEYAFPIGDVQEIVQLPEEITAVPNSAPHVLGVITLRQRLLPLVSLRRMFALPPAAVTDANKVVVVSLGGDQAVGVVMDSIKEVLRVSRAHIDAMPGLLTRNRALDDISAICRLDGGKRLVSVLSARDMFRAGELSQLVAAEGETSMTTQQGEPAVLGGDDEEQFVVFRLMNEEYGVPIASVQEIVRVPEELTHIPKSPPFIEGVINLRGSVLPVVDQRRRFGLEPSQRSDRQRIMVFTIHGVRSGFIVDQVSEVMRIGARFIGTAPQLSAEQQRLIRRVANLEGQKRMILLLDIDQLLNVGELGVIRENTGRENTGREQPAA